jgi:hypothetical protein
MTAAARGTFGELEERGELTIEGDRSVADEFLDRLRVV